MVCWNIKKPIIKRSQSKRNHRIGVVIMNEKWDKRFIWIFRTIIGMIIGAVIAA